MTTPVGDTRGTRRLGIPRGASVVAGVAWATRLLGLLVLLSVVLPAGRGRLRPMLLHTLGLGRQAGIATSVLLIGAGVLLLLLAAALARRKRRAWQLAVLVTGFIAAVHLTSIHQLGVGLAAAALLAFLLATQREFHALPDPVMGRWRAQALIVELVAAGVGINVVILSAGRRYLVGAPTAGAELRQASLALVGLPGPIAFTNPVPAELTTGVGMLFGLTALVAGMYFLLRSSEPAPSLSDGEAQHLRALLRAHGQQDSLGYFTLRRDKSVVFSLSGKAAVTYRVLAGVALASGDPLGDAEAWPGAITAFLDRCRRYGWTAAVLGCSEHGATVWARHGLDALELGDEAVVHTVTFCLEGRAMRGVRQMAARARRAGYVVRVRRAGDVTCREHTHLAELAHRWRGTGSERGYSMALGRLADSDDPDCVFVTAERDGDVRALLQLVPWGGDGLSLDLMRRDPAATDTGLNELMIADMVLACPAMGVRRVSLNFAVLRSALERGRRIGAGPVARMWARLLRLASRWWQIDSLYRFNAKFHPDWVPRFVAFPAMRDLPRVGLAALEAEGFGGRPPVVLRFLRRRS